MGGGGRCSELCSCGLTNAAISRVQSQRPVLMHGVAPIVPASACVWEGSVVDIVCFLGGGGGGWGVLLWPRSHGGPSHPCTSLHGRRENGRFLQVLRRLEGQPVCRRQPLKSFLVLPFQRITRLKMLLEVRGVHGAGVREVAPSIPLWRRGAPHPSPSL